MSSHQSNTLLNSGPFEKKNEDSLSLEGLDHIFRWASEVVADGEDTRVRIAREKRIKREVLETVQKAREQKILADATNEIAYLQRRVIALLAKIQEVLEENSTLKQMVVSQYYGLQRVAALEYELNQLRSNQIEKEAAVTERRYLMDALAKMKVERDYLEEMLTSTEADNSRLGSILRDTRSQLEELKSKRWWHYFIPKMFLPTGETC